MIRSHRSRATWQRALKRLAADPHVLLAAAVVLAALVIDWAAQGQSLVVFVPSVAYLGVQAALGLSRRVRRSPTADTTRLLLAVAAVLWMSVGTGDNATLPLASLILPIVAMAAALGTRQTIIVGATIVSAALVLYFVPDFATPTIQTGLIQRGIALGATGVVLAVLTRRTVLLLERAAARARTASAGHRRRGR